MPARLLLIVSLIFHLSCFSQIDQNRLDSLSHAIDSASKNVQTWQDSFSRRQDSIYQNGINWAGESVSVKKIQQWKQWTLLLASAIGLAAFALLYRVVRRKKGE